MDEEEKVEVEEGKEQQEVNVEDLAGNDLDPNLLTGGEPIEEKVEPEKKEEAKPLKPSEKEKEFSSRISRLESDKKDLQKALHEARQEKKKGKDEPELSYDELVKIVEENKGDPKVVLNAAAYYAKQQMKKAKGEAVNEVEVTRRKGELDTILRSRVTGFDDEGSDSRRAINDMKGKLSLDDHPFADFLATASILYFGIDKVREEFIEQGKKMALDGKAEENREKGIKERQPSPGGTKGSGGKGDGGGLSATQMETAKKLGFTTPAKLKIYAGILKGKTPAEGRM